MVVAGLTMPLAGWARHARSDTPQLALSNRHGISVRPSRDEPAAPLLWIALPGMEHPSVVIEMPEHAWGRPRGTTEQRWFYRMYSETRSLRPPARWTKQDGALICSLTSPAGVRLQTAVSVDDEGISVRHALENDRDVDYEEVQAPSCIKLYRPFADVFLERTYVHHPEGLDLLASETPARLQMNAEEWLPVRYIVRSAPPGVPSGKHKERLDNILRYNKLRLADAPFMATTSTPGGWVVASHTLEASSIFTNPARTCHHVDPSAVLKPRGEAILSLKVYVVRGTVEDAWRLVRKRRIAGMP